jgi:hypothetical protein
MLKIITQYRLIDFGAKKGQIAHGGVAAHRQRIPWRPFQPVSSTRQSGLIAPRIVKMTQRTI